MEEQGKKNTAADITAENEKNITPLQLLQEIQPLLNEYFIGEFNIVNNAVNMIFKNGQNFKLAIGEVVCV